MSLDTPHWQGKQQILWAALATAAMGIVWLLVQEPLAPLLVLGGIAALMLSIRFPAQVALAFVIFSYLRLHEAYPFLFQLRLPFVLAALTMSSLAWNLFVARTLKPYMTLELKFAAAFFVVATVEIAFSLDRQTSWAFVSGPYWKVAVMTFATAWLTRTESDLAWVARAILIAGALVGARAIYNRWVGIDLLEGTRVAIGRDFGSSLGDPNDLALTLLLPLSIGAAFLVHRSGHVQTALAGLCLATILSAIAVTQSRGGLLGVTAVALVLVSRFRRFRLASFGLAAVVILTVYLVMDIGDRPGMAVEEGLDESAQGRLDAWGAALRMAAAHPLTGIGIANFGNLLYLFLPRHSQAAHSTWFEVLGETGIPGFALFLAMFFRSVRSAVVALFYFEEEKSRTSGAVALGVLGGMAGFAVAGSFLSQAYSWPLYVMVSLAAALHRSSSIRAAYSGAGHVLEPEPDASGAGRFGYRAARTTPARGEDGRDC